jgi:hypothetical protein
MGKNTKINWLGASIIGINVGGVTGFFAGLVIGYRV